MTEHELQLKLSVSISWTKTRKRGVRNPGITGRSVVNITPRPLYPRVENLSIHGTGGCVSSRDDPSERGKSLALLVFEPRTVQSVAISYTDYVVNNEWEIIGKEEIADEFKVTSQFGGSRSKLQERQNENQIQYGECLPPFGRSASPYTIQNIENKYAGQVVLYGCKFWFLTF
jgi:hypothetical protein